jgi:DNA-binding XRE family transcriptional regulator
MPTTLPRWLRLVPRTTLLPPGAKMNAASPSRLQSRSIEAKLDGAHPVRAWRDYRGWTQADLAVRSGVRRDLIAQIETHKKKGSIFTLARLAGVLGVPIEALTEDLGG